MLLQEDNNRAGSGAPETPAPIDSGTAQQPAPPAPSSDSQSFMQGAPTSTELTTTDTPISPEPNTPESTPQAQPEPVVEAQPVAAVQAQPEAVAQVQPEAEPEIDDFDMDDDKGMESMDFATALEAYSNPEPEQATGEERVIKGTILKVTSTQVVVDIGQKSEGMVPISEVTGPDGVVTVQPGQEIDVMLDKGETEEGYIRLSHQRAQRLRAWDEIDKAYNDKTPIKATVIERIKGGLTVDILGARAFLPGSQVDLRPVRNLEGLRSQAFEVRVIKLNKKRGNIVVSRKQLLEEEVSEKRGLTLESLHEGAVLTGVVKKLTDYGAFLSLIHI